MDKFEQKEMVKKTSFQKKHLIQLINYLYPQANTKSSGWGLRQNYESF